MRHLFGGVRGGGRCERLCRRGRNRIVPLPAAGLPLLSQKLHPPRSRPSGGADLFPVGLLSPRTADCPGLNHSGVPAATRKGRTRNRTQAGQRFGSGFVPADGLCERQTGVGRAIGTTPRGKRGSASAFEPACHHQPSCLDQHQWERIFSSMGRCWVAHGDKARNGRAGFLAWRLAHFGFCRAHFDFDLEIHDPGIPAPPAALKPLRVAIHSCPLNCDSLTWPDTSPKNPGMIVAKKAAWHASPTTASRKLPV